MKTELRSVCVTGMGVVSCLGNGVDTFWERVKNGDSGISDGLGYAHSSDTIYGTEVDGRAFELSMTAATEAFSQAGITSLSKEDGFILATTTGQIDIWSSEFVQFLSQKSSQEHLEVIFRHQSLGALLDSLSAKFGQPGKTALITSACSAATQAIALAAMWIRQGRVRRCVVGGVEILSSLTVEGFKSLQLLATGPARPFDQGRKGINLSEGAGFLVLESDESRTVPALGKVAGFGLTTDAFHMTGPHPEGAGCLGAMARALGTSHLQKEEISWVHAHGTGSDLNDLSEGRAIAKFFEGASRVPPVSSTKYSHGHALGASGALESILCLESIRRQTILKSGGLEIQDARIPVTLVRESAPMKLNHVLKNTLGFGGVNAALILSRGDA